jgi:hypothetical protein
VRWFIDNGRGPLARLLSSILTLISCDLTKRQDPLFWGMGTETFSYSNRSLQKVIFDQMERNDWVGVCCEPNMVFVVCNQFPVRRWSGPGRATLLTESSSSPCGTMTLEMGPTKSKRC